MMAFRASLAIDALPARGLLLRVDAIPYGTHDRLSAGREHAAGHDEHQCRAFSTERRWSRHDGDCWSVEGLPLAVVVAGSEESLSRCFAAVRLLESRRQTACCHQLPEESGRGQRFLVGADAEGSGRNAQRCPSGLVLQL